MTAVLYYICMNLNLCWVVKATTILSTRTMAIQNLFLDFLQFYMIANDSENKNIYYKSQFSHEKNSDSHMPGNFIDFELKIFN